MLTLMRIYDGKQFVRLESEGVGTGVQGGESGVAGTEGMEVEIRIPKALYHLTQEEWEQICQILSHLMWQRENSQVH